MEPVGWIRFNRPTVAIAAVMLAFAAARGAESAPSVILRPYNVVESVLNVKFRILYRSTFVGAFVANMFLGEVKTPSIAQRAGLKSGMEIVAIQGRPVTGLNQIEVEQILSQPVEDSVVLLVRRSPRTQPEQVRLQVDPVPAKP
jgi:membrane-associated protease RseP (regulator of RpoE activity)